MHDALMQAMKGNALSLSQFMTTALYHPGHGYYQRKNPIGREGDFTTAPVMSSLFAYPIAKQCQAILQACKDQGAMILELGPGSGHLAAALLPCLESLGALPASYGLFDVSARLQAVQKKYLKQMLPERLYRLCHWYDAYPEAFSGVVLGNEVLDALAVEQVQCTEQGVQARCIVWSEGQWQWSNRPAQGDLVKAITRIEPWLSKCPVGYVAEINVALQDWFSCLDRCFVQGGMLWLDYGYHIDDYYLPTRSCGTLMAYEDHKAWEDVLQRPGHRDITAHVEFSSLAAIARLLGYQPGGWTTQGNFLVNAGIAEHLDPSDWQATQALKPLLMPYGMGEMFKVMGLEKGVDIDWLGFAKHDHWSRLNLESLVW